MHNIQHQSLIKSGSFVNGQWLDSDTDPDQKFDVVNPATEEVLTCLSEVNSLQLELAVTSAYKALSVWQGYSETERSEKLNAWQLLMVEHKDDLARLLTLEQGKPLEEAKGEILHAASYVKLYSELAASLKAPSQIKAGENQKAQVFRRPIGVVTAITPWNFPCAMVLRKAAAAMAAGCTVVLKPSELTPLSALALAELSVEAGIPAGVFNVVVGSNAQAIGEILTQHPKVAKLSFTGSTKIGKKLLQQCASGVKRTSMELGGNAPFIVFEDADINAAVKGAMASKFRNAGQTCVTANRFIIHENIVEKFTQILLKSISSLNIANGLNANSEYGPLINLSALEKMQSLVKQAIEEGGNLLTGGQQLGNEGYFFQPTVIDNVNPNMSLFQKEIFGPVVSITTFKTDEEAIKFANQTELGLCGYLYTQDQVRINSIAVKLELGMLGINEARLSNPLAPFGGIKQSGMGREGGHYGIEEYLDYQYVCQTDLLG